jgi:hypothetical protein
MNRRRYKGPMIKLLYVALFAVFLFGSFGQAVLPDYHPPKQNVEDVCADDACDSDNDGTLTKNEAASPSHIPSAIITPAPKVNQLRVSLNPFSKFVTTESSQPLLKQAVPLVLNIACKEVKHTGGISGQIIPLPRNDLPPLA